MSSVDEYPDMMTPDTTANVEEKVKDYLAYPKIDEQELRLVVYGDKELVTQQMWNSIFRDDLPNVVYKTFLPLIPIPVHYTPECYTQYEKELRQCVATWATKENFIWDLYNVAAPEQVPRMHLLLANRLVKRSEYGRWVQTDESGSLESDGAHQDSRFISIDVLRTLVWKLLDLDSVLGTLRGRQFDQQLDLSRTSASGAECQARRSTWSSSSVSSVGSSTIWWPPTSSGKRGRKSAQPVDRNRTSASGAERPARRSVSLSRQTDYKHPIIIEEVAAIIGRKVKIFHSWFPDDNKKQLKVLVFADKEPLSCKMWKKIFRGGLMFYSYMEFSLLLPIPDNYTPERYQVYEQELRKHVAKCIESSDLILGLYNLAVPGQYPRIHLVLANRPVKRSELWCGAQTDQSEKSKSDEGSQDPRFISLESLRGMVSNLLDVSPLSSIPEGSSATSSASTSRGKSVRRFAHVLDVSRTSSSDAKPPA